MPELREGTLPTGVDSEPRLCIVCGEPVLPHRRKYCSLACSKARNRSSAAERSRIKGQEYKIKCQVDYKPRTCLSCDETFKSKGPQNRICKACKDKREIGVDVAPTRWRGLPCDRPSSFDGKMLRVQPPIG